MIDDMTDHELSDTEIQAGLAKIRELAAQAIATFGPLSDVAFGFNRPSVVWVEGYIERDREHRGSEGDSKAMVDLLGAFLGECLLDAIAGEWIWDDYQQDWCVALAAGGRVFPMGKVWKLYHSGLAGGESIVSFYDVVVDFLAKGKLPTLPA